MASRSKQENRYGRMKTVLGAEALVLRSFHGTDHVDDLFEYEVEAETHDLSLKLDQLLGTGVEVVFESTEHPDRHFHGIVTGGRWVAADEDDATFRLTLRPWFALLEHRRHQRIFKEKTVEEIIISVFSYYENLLSVPYKFELSKSYPTLEYTVQHQETDLNFVRRLMERFGLSFAFQHSEGAHKMLITDTLEKFEKIPGESRELRNVADGHDGHAEIFWHWDKGRSMTTGAVRMKDFNFKFPTAMMEVEKQSTSTHEVGRIEAYDYPGGYLTEPDGKTVTEHLILQERGRDHRHTAEGDCFSLGAGLRVTLKGQAPEQVKGKEYLCLSATHRYSGGSFRSGGGGEGGQYSGSYIFVPMEADYGPEVKTPRAIVHGPQTAMVVGDDEIDCDEFGRIIVLFHWDLEKMNSMRCRVSQNWAGNGWGGMVIPRVGMEVVVEFLDGDPDKPLVTGCVYNGKNAVPYDLPSNKTRSTFKTDTHNGQGFNELRFEDASGKEEIFIHAQRDRNTKVENNQSERVNVNKVESVGHNKASEIGNNLTQVVDGSMDLRVGPGNAAAITPAGSDDSPEGLPTIAAAQGKKGSGIGKGDLNLSVENNKSQTVGANHNEDVGKDKKTTVGGKFHQNVGKDFELVAGDKITLHVGQSKIVMDAAGNITVNGMKFNLTTKGLTQIKGSMVKIN